MPRVCAAVLVLAALPAVAHAQPELGAPRSIRTATPADALPRDRSHFEEWSLHLVDPRSRALLVIAVDRTVSRTDVRIWAHNGRRTLEVQGFGGSEPARRRLSWASQFGRLDMTRRARTWFVNLQTPRASVRLRIGRTRPGATARRWRLGRISPGGPMHVSWATPIASGRVTGAYQIEEPSPLGVTRFDLRGWRATLEHSWGSLNRLRLLFTGWEHAAVHTPHGPTWILHGLTRFDFDTGPGARDAFWQGLLTRVDARGVRVCRPALVRRVPDLHARPPVRTWIMRARCPGARLALRALSSTTFVTRSDDWDETESRVSSRPAGFGWWRSASQPGP